MPMQMYWNAFHPEKSVVPEQSAQRLANPAAAQQSDKHVRACQNKTVQCHVDAAVHDGADCAGLVAVEIGCCCAVHAEQQQKHCQRKQQLCDKRPQQHPCAGGVHLAANVPALVTLREQGYLKAGQQNLRQKPAVIRPVCRILQRIVKGILRVDLSGRLLGKGLVCHGLTSFEFLCSVV